MTCHEFKGGIGTASRRVAGPGPDVDRRRPRPGQPRPARAVRGQRRPVGLDVGVDVIPGVATPPSPPGSGSIIGVVATDARCCRCSAGGWRSAAPSASRGPAASARTAAATCSSRSRPATAAWPGSATTHPPSPTVRTLANARMTPLFDAVVEATEEAILNAILAASTMTGKGGTTAHTPTTGCCSPRSRGTAARLLAREHPPRVVDQQPVEGRPRRSPRRAAGRRTSVTT